MIIDMTIDGLRHYVEKQLLNLLDSKESIAPYVSKAISRTEQCFRATKNKYYHDNQGEPCFSPFHSGQYSIFLYYLANTIHRYGGSVSLATKVYYLNKILNSVDWYYEIELPNYFGLEHPLGSVLGRAKYSDGFFFYQGCTVGGNKGKYPTLGKNVIMFSNTTVIGNSVIGDNVFISTGSIIKDEVIPSNCIVFGSTPKLIIKSKSKTFFEEKMTDFWQS